MLTGVMPVPGVVHPIFVLNDMHAVHEHENSAGNGVMCMDCTLTVSVMLLYFLYCVV